MPRRPARAYSAAGDLRAADVAPGTELAALIERLFADADTADLHVRNARPGCYARIDRA